MVVSHYKYKPLIGTDEIRVLELTANKARTELRILHVPASSGSYQALSYAWGGQNDTTNAIVLDDDGRSSARIRLTKNLNNALRDLRDTGELKRKVFWIDQICINQQDKIEKSNQVAMMSQIYAQARRVITYLGPADCEEKEERGIRLLEKIRGTITFGAWHKMHEAGTLHQILAWKEDGSIQLNRFPSDLDLEFDESDESSGRYVEQGWEWLVQVAYGSWTQRLWMVQEQLLNKEIVTLRGHRLINWDDIATIPILFAIDHLPQRYREAGLKDLDESLPSSSNVELTLYGIWWDRHARIEPNTDYTWSKLFHNMTWYQPLLCGDPRDRVYAILAISQDAEILGLRPDYSPSNTTDALSIRLSTRVIETGDSLDPIIWALSSRQPNSTLPSWCLALDLRPNFSAPGINVGYNKYKPHPEPGGPHLARFLSDNSTLVAKGQILDYVAIPHSSIAALRHDTNNTPQIEFISSLVYLLSDGVTLKDAACLLRTVIAGELWSPPPVAEVSADEINAFHFWAYLRSLSGFLAEYADSSSPAAKELQDHYDHIMAQIKAVTPYIAYCELQPDDYLAEAEDSAVERVFKYILQDGRFIGRTRAGRFYNATSSIQEGDAIVVLRGATFLFFIRLINNSYKIVGDIVVDGLMQGEAYEDKSPDELDYDIELT